MVTDESKTVLGQFVEVDSSHLKLGIHLIVNFCQVNYLIFNHQQPKLYLKAMTDWHIDSSVFHHTSHEEQCTTATCS